MGKVTKFILKVGATGSTARWVAKHYMRLSKEGFTDNEIFHELVTFRYKVFKMQGVEEKLRQRLSYITNLSDLTFSILQLEGALKTKNMPMDMQMEALSVIMEELKKAGVPNEIITKTNTDGV